MSEPWFDPVIFGTVMGTVGGGVGGALGGFLGAAIGTLAPRGKGRWFIIPALWFFIVLGICGILFGLVALVAGQPIAIWGLPILVGVIYAGVMGSVLPVTCLRYEEAEQRRIDSEGLRRS